MFLLLLELKFYSWKLLPYNYLIAIKNEKRTASSLFTPKSNNIEIVIPDLDIPGNKAKIWNKPTMITIFKFNLFKPLKYFVKNNIIDVSIRPARLSNDKSNIIDAIKYDLKKVNSKLDILLLQPTSPFRSYVRIKNAIKYYKKNKIES